MHAKTAVADSRWARVGSSNLNISSWIGNYELDVAVEHEPFACQMEEVYLQDLERATEIVLNPRNRVRPSLPAYYIERRRTARGAGSAGRAAASALRIGNTVGAALTNRRILGPAEAGLTANIGIALLLLAVLGMAWPEVVAVPVGVVAGWIGLSLLVKAWRLRRGEAREREDGDAGESDQP
jgi:cardiolipin synthase